ncbi:Fatty acyl-CoA reductase wat-like protein [Cladobotryum mycophilum]|uniref:Fatty acyl-CoA reductase n=1 Tax=Cladobotryum mycophilum TaxID=491253 RepID=A0ABR0SNF9_9HYPO
MSDTNTARDSIHDYYKDRHVFFTGASGMLGTAYMHRLVLDTAVSCVYALVRGGESRLWKHWSTILPSETVEALQQSQKIVVWDGDITLPNCGLSEDQVKTIHDNVSIVVHSASTINLQKPLAGVAPHIIEPSLAMAEMALGCANLTRFVYVSTAFASAFVRTREDGTVEGSDAVIPEGVVPVGTQTSLEDEYSQLLEHGTTEEYELVSFPFPYAYCKQLTERLLARLFQEERAEEKLLILKPSIFGPAESLPYPFYEIPGTTPGTSAAAIFISAFDEVPIDMVVNSLVAHVAFETCGSVNAVNGIDRVEKTEDVFDMVWSKESWKSKKLCDLAKLFRVCGCRFNFARDKTVAIWDRMNAVEKSNWPLEPQMNRTVDERFVGRVKTIRLMLAQLIPRFYNIPSSHIEFFHNAKL